MDLKKNALEYHRGKGNRSGKIGTKILTSVNGKNDLSLAYTPGVAEPCLEIVKDKNEAYDYTNKGNSVAVVSNGTAVLGLGNIGSLAGKPVMEGKALLFKHFGDVDAVDVLIDSEDVEEIIRTVELISPTYGGINLEDIKAPECFEIEERLKKILSIPVFHDDQHGTAIVVGAGLLNALKIARKKIGDVKIVFSGAGAAGISCAKMVFGLGARKENIVVCDSKGVISKNRDGLHESKMEFASNVDGKLKDVIVGADIFIGVSKAGVLTPEMLLSMAKNPIVFAMANPNPEIDYNLALSTRKDIIMATGRSDFPNQVNNVLAFPGIFRGTLDCRACDISEGMKIAAVYALADLVEIPKRDEFIISPFERGVVINVAFRVAEAAVREGIAMSGFDLNEYRNKLEKRFLMVDGGEKYQHFKGGEYEVIEAGWDSDSFKKVIIYRELCDSHEFGKNPVWVRGYDDFIGFKEVDGKKIKRFEKLNG
jgi:malate dehydrogenase (oxaloacetate-decarboxylating)(NADP+)